MGQFSPSAARSIFVRSRGSSRSYPHEIRLSGSIFRSWRYSNRGGSLASTGKSSQNLPSDEAPATHSIGPRSTQSQIVGKQIYRVDTIGLIEGGTRLWQWNRLVWQ